MIELHIKELREAVESYGFPSDLSKLQVIIVGEVLRRELSRWHTKDAHIRILVNDSNETEIQNLIDTGLLKGRRDYTTDGDEIFILSAFN